MLFTKTLTTSALAQVGSRVNLYDTGGGPEKWPKNFENRFQREGKYLSTFIHFFQLESIIEIQPARETVPPSIESHVRFRAIFRQ